MNDRDHFAAAALTGLLNHNHEPPKPVSWWVEQAYEYADAMLRERERTNHDAAPAARATTKPGGLNSGSASGTSGNSSPVTTPSSGTGDTPVTDPMPKEKRAEVSDGEPVAWAVEDDRGLQIALHPTPEHASYYARNFGSGLSEVVPLYRQPQPTLTDAEREAIGNVLHHIATRADHLQREAHDLRGLLERMGGGR